MIQKLQFKVSIAVMALLAGLSGMAFTSPSPASALSGSDFKAPRIIDDTIFFNSTSMSSSEIKNFLDAKVPTCDTNGAKMYNSTMTRAEYGSSQGSPAPYTCLKDYSQSVPEKLADSYCKYMAPGTKTSSQIIYDVSQACGVSPKVLIVLLQKEQSLITDDWPWPIQYRSATGYGCPDTAPCDAEYYGYFNQVYHAARQFQRYVKQPELFNYSSGKTSFVQYNPNSGCSGTNVLIETSSTAALYNYTPYQPNQAALNNLYGSGDGCSAYGNRNFWRMYHDWFGTTTGTKIIKKSSSSSFYLYSGGKKFLIPSAYIYESYGFNKVAVTQVSDAFLDAIADGGTLSNLARTDDGAVYLLTNGIKYRVQSLQQCADWGLDCENPFVVMTVDSESMNIPSNGWALQPLMHNNGTVYQMLEGKKLPLSSPAALSERNFGFHQITPVDSLVADKPLGIALLSQGTAIKFASGETVYVYTDGSFAKVGNIETFYAWRLDKNYLTNFPSSYDTVAPTASGSLSTVVTHDSKSYIVDNGIKYDITSVTPTSVYASSSFATSLLSSLPISAVSISTPLKTSEGTIQLIENDKSRRIMSVSDFFANGYKTTDIISLPHNSSNFLAKGAAKLPSAKLFKTETDPAIKLVYSENVSYTLPSLESFYALGLNSNQVSVVSIETSEYYSRDNKVLPSVTTYSDGFKFLFSTDGKRYHANSITLDEWGYGPVTTLLPYGIGGNLETRTMTRFARTSDGTIYYAGAGQKRLITSYEKFVQLGGTNSNVMNVYDDFANSLPTGSPI